MNIDKINNNDNIKNNGNNDINKNIENSQTKRINKENKSNHTQVSSEIRNIGNNIGENNIEFQKLFLSKRTIIYYKIVPKISYMLNVIYIS